MIVPRIDHHPRTNRVQFDVSQTIQKVTIFLNQARLEPPLKQGATAGVSEIEETNIQSSEVLKQLRYRIIMSGRQQEMHMVGHKNPPMNRYLILRRAFFQPVRISRNVAVGGKHHLAVVSALDDVYRIACGTKPRMSWHFDRLEKTRL